MIFELPKRYIRCFQWQKRSRITFFKRDNKNRNPKALMD